MILALSTYVKVTGQVAPPPMAMPADSNTVLIDKIIELTDHEKYFIDYCTMKVMAFAKENKWKKEKTSEILNSIKFEYYNSTIYNSYAFCSTSQLTKLVDALTELAKDIKNSGPFILTNSMMQNNLDLFVKGVIEGKYVVKN